MQTVQIFVFVVASGFGIRFGFGVTPQQAVDAAVAEGAKRKDIPAGRLLRLPEGITAYGVDEMGSTHWEGAPNGRPVYYTYDKKTKQWNDPAVPLCTACRMRPVAPADDYPEYARLGLCPKCGADHTIDADEVRS